MSVYDKRDKNDKVLTWAVGVPIGSNPLIILDFLTVLAIAFGLCLIVVLAAQLYFDGYVELQHVFGAAWVAFDLDLLLLAFYVIVCFGVLRNRYAAVYRLDNNGVYGDNRRSFPRALVGRLVNWRAFPIENAPVGSKSVPRHNPWGDVTSVAELPELGVLILKGRHGMLQRLYCPNAETFAAARQFVRDHAGV